MRCYAQDVVTLWLTQSRVPCSLKSKSRGTGPSRHNVLYRTMHTSIRTANAHKVQRFLSMTSTWDMRTPTSGKLQLKGQSRSTGAPRNAEGRLVGEGADRIAADNIGHQMLAKMGWAAGEQIGRGGGLEEPLSAVVKTNKAVRHLIIFNSYTVQAHLFLTRVSEVASYDTTEVRQTCSERTIITLGFVSCPPNMKRGEHRRNQVHCTFEIATETSFKG